jgi:hypothetical protein
VSLEAIDRRESVEELTVGLLKPLDLVIVLFYVVSIALIGLQFYRRNADLQEYLLGSKKMKWLPVALSILVADSSAISYRVFRIRMARTQHDPSSA